MPSSAIADPFLFRFAVPRLADAPMPGRYCAEHAVWVVESKSGDRPIVELNHRGLSDTQTKTMTQVEADDDDPAFFGSLETSTFTRVRQEVDDEDATLPLPELQTKTEVQHERDDETTIMC